MTTLYYSHELNRRSLSVSYVRGTGAGYAKVPENEEYPVLLDSFSPVINSRVRRYEPAKEKWVNDKETTNEESSDERSHVLEIPSAGKLEEHEMDVAEIENQAEDIHDENAEEATALTKDAHDVSDISQDSDIESVNTGDINTFIDEAIDTGIDKSTQNASNDGSQQEAINLETDTRNSKVVAKKDVSTDDQEAEMPQPDGDPSFSDTTHAATVEQAVEAPHCDMIPLVGGRYFWRNRSRLVDYDRQEICGPKVLLVGAMKCGTNTIAHLLQKHPRIQLNTCSLVNTMGGCNDKMFQGARQGLIFEGHDFTHVKHSDPDGWLHAFAKRLPLTDGISSITFDKSPSYLDTQIFPDVVETAKQYLPNAKIVVTVCNPAERLYSELQHLMKVSRGEFDQFYHDNGVSPPDNFGSFVNLLMPDNPICNEKPGFCEANRRLYLQKGEYLNNLTPWYEAYGHQNVLVLDLHNDPNSIISSLLHHVGSDLLPDSEYPWEEATRMIQYGNNEYDGRPSAYEHFHQEMQWLDRYYAPHNDELALFLDAGWPKKWSCRLNNTC